MFLNRRFKLKKATIFILLCFGLYLYFVFRYFFDGSSDEFVYQKNLDLNPDSNSGIDKVNINDIEQFRRLRFEKAKNRPLTIQGPGEDGTKVILTEEEQKEADKLFARETYNVVASEKVAMDRRLVDIRHPDCHLKKYPKDLPKASVVVIFCNEAPSGLLRTVHSVVNRSPPEYLQEVILVDDFSDRPELKEPLERNISASWPDGIVKLVRAERRLGLIRAKNLGAEKAQGDVLVFLDAHCEATDHWLEPILARIQEKPNVVVCPAVDLIDDKNMEYSRNGGISVGGFTWSLHFTWRSVPEKEKKIRNSDADPVRSPTMAGGLLASGRDFFFHIGGYDPGMYTWGGENLELSFRTWMCGGELEFIPCSRVGHIFRAAHPYKFDHSDSHGYNSKRLAEVWMDEYKRLFYNHRSDLKTSDAGNYTDRIELRKKLNCKSFKWFLDNVFPEQFIIDENSQAYGMLRNPESNLCLDTLSRNHKTDPYIAVFPCSGGLSHNQMFALSQINELRMEEVCADAVGSAGVGVKLMDCHELRGNQLWKYNKDKLEMRHASGYCLDASGLKMNDNVKLNHCSGADSQKWEFEHILKFI